MAPAIDHLPGGRHHVTRVLIVKRANTPAGEPGPSLTAPTVEGSSLRLFEPEHS